MIAELPWQDRHLRIDLSAGQSLAITLDPHGPQPSFFAPAPAQSRPLRVGDYVGDVSLGGSCNAEVLEFIPHCHGTHTECRAHLDKSAGHVLDIIDQQPCLAMIISLDGMPFADCQESYPVPLGDEEVLLTLDEILSIQGISDMVLADALIVRTRPNEMHKKTRDYASNPAYPVLSSEAMNWLSEQDLKHLLIDTPSLDRADDSGGLANHRCWWAMNGQDHTGLTDPKKRSVTEMIYVPEHVEDGFAWLHLELQPLAADATSSRPIVYPVEVMTQ